jgi:endonuclease/exonuclease/phosphatase family metal-dependent hydrolase
MFARKSLAPKIQGLASTKLKLGFSGQMGNKGANLIRFTYHDTSFCFVNCHLESGFSEDLITKRAEQINAIFETAFVTQRGTTESHYSLGSHQVKILLGDFNYRIFRDYSQICRLI